ncbi:universal stress protein [Naasia aerilata]|uniref:Universal stress protein n=1 Tax=Naasia aerilata TaxID=1162966 RepID=A0ABN6XP81_9MICO|nr:universal stress protein [Naasia aerilata]BDZ46689.1 universal stress protein [Naasia aerilata]
MSIGKVTVGVDGSPASRKAVEWAVERCRRTGASLLLLAIAPVSDVRADFEDPLRRYYRDAAGESADWVRVHAPNVAVTVEVRGGHPAEELVKSSEETDLLVVGTDKESALRKLVYGTVPLRLAALSASPLVVVPGTWQPGAGAVLLAVGADAPDDHSVDLAVSQAEQLGAELEMVHVWSAASNFPSPLSAIGYPWQLLEQSGRQVLDDAVRRVAERHPDLAVTSRLVEGPTVPRLAELAHGAQLLVVGHGGRGIFRELLQLGSVAHDILLSPPAPVAVVPTHRKAGIGGRGDREASAGGTTL